jgi:hypothetical protein
VPIGTGRYSPLKVVSGIKTVNIGSPANNKISTSLVERQNLIMPMPRRRFVRLTNGFSKKVENFKATVGLHFVRYSLVHQQKSLGLALPR